MMSRKWVFAACLGLFALSLTVSAGVTDPNIIASVVRYNSSRPAPVLVPGGLVQGAQVFSDRTTIFWGNPGTFNGIDYIQTAMDDKAEATVQYEVGLKGPGTLFLIVDNRVGDGVATNPPTLGTKMAWVSALGFTQTAYTIGFNEQSTVYSKVFTASDPNVITLGEQNDGTSRAMYSIAAIPQGWNMAPTISGVPATAQLLPGQTLAINATTADDGIPGTGLSILWSVTAQPLGSSVTFDPDNTSEDPTISFSTDGSYTLQMAVSDGELTGVWTLQVTVAYPVFAAHATDGNNDVEIGYDGSMSSGSRNVTSTGLGVRNIATRRRLSYVRINLADLGALGTNEVFANSFLSIRSTSDRTGTLRVYGVRENLDNFSMSSIDWDMEIGVVKVASDSPVTLDMADLTEELVSMTFPAANTRYSSTVSPALADFLNSDNDGVVTFMVAGITVGDNMIVSSRNYTTAGTGYIAPGTTAEKHGVVLVTEKRVPTWASKPEPANYAISSSDLSQVKWDNPPQPVGTITCDVYFGTDPNPTLPHYGLTKIADGISGNTATIPALAFNQTYYWIIDIHDSGATPELTEGMLWRFITSNSPPTANAGADQYEWFGNNGDPTKARIDLVGTTSDADGLPNGTLTRLWTQVSPASPTYIDPNGLILATGQTANTDSISFDIAQTGTYQFQLKANDSALTATDIVRVIVAETACKAAAEMDDYTALVGDLDKDCNVDMDDLSIMIDHWLDCSSLAPCF